MEEANPYQAPASVEGETPPPPAAGRLPMRLLAGWTAIFLLNMPLPLLFAGEVTRNHGRSGVFVASATLWLLGGWVCVAQRKVGFALAVGGAPVALSQIVPLLQIMAGIVALTVGELFQQVENKDDAVGQVVSEPGGFLLTMITGSLLMGAALVLGLLLRALMPARWREAASPGNSS
jgi:hypothetical protein